MSVALIPLPGYAAKSQDKNVSDAGFCSILTKLDQSDYITADSKNESKQVNNLVKTVKADIKKDEAKKRAAKKKKAEEKKAQKRRERIESQLISTGGSILRRGLLSILKRK